jgi:hypothetical protein
MFHTKTLDVMARVGVDFILNPQEEDDRALTVYEIPSDSDDEDEDYGDNDFFDSWSGSDSWSEDRESDKEVDETNDEDYCFMSQGDNYKMNQNTWLGDSAASTHMGFSDEGMTDVEIINSPVRIGNGKALTATKIGKRRITVIQKDGSSQDAVLEEYKCVPELWVNLFSISKSLHNGWNISNKGVEITITKGKAKIVFDRIIKTSKGLVVGVKILPRNDAMANVMLDRGKSVDINVLHAVLGHPSQEITKKTAEYYGWTVKGTFNPCADCQMAKSKQNAVTKESDTRSTIPGERLFIDTSSVKAKSFGGSKFWLLVVDDCTDVAWSAFLNKKSDQVERITVLVKELEKKHKITVKYIRCDNAGENGSLEKECAKQGLGIQFEYTGPGTPQFNGRVERKFATLYSKVRAMLNGAKLPTVKRKGLWTEAARTATDLENILVSTRKPIASYNAFFEKELPGLRNMRTFGEIAIVNDHKKRKMRGKLDDRGRPCLLLGRAENHNRDVYRFLNLETDRIIRSRDALWLNKQYGEWKGITRQNITNLDDDDDDEPFLDISLDASRDIQTGSEPETAVDRIEVVDEDDNPIQPKLARALKKLSGFLSPEAQTITDRVRATTRSASTPANDPNDQSGREDTLNVLIDRFDEDFDTVPDFAFLVAEVEKTLTPEQMKTGAMKNTYEKLSPAEYKYVFDVPAKFREAWDHPDPWQREKWRTGIRAEFAKMNKNQVWRKVKRTTMPHGRRCVKHKWVFDIKRDGIFKARLVACGYSQIPGVDFTDVYSPVVHDVTFRIMLVAELKWKLKSKIVDVESAFLNGDLEEEIYMDCPDGMEHDPDECLLLLKAIYGLVQSARQFFKKFVSILRKIGFIPSDADPCLMIRKCSLGLVYMAMYIDDCYCNGNKAAINDTIKGIVQNGLNVTVKDDLEDYLSCEIRFNKARTKAWLGQPHLIKKLEKKFGEMVMGLMKYKTPGTPHTGIVRPKEGDLLVDEPQQELYRSGVGMLLYLVKHSRPDIANAVRELSKCMTGANAAAFKELMRVIKFVLDTRAYGLKLAPKWVDTMLWELKIYSDSDWAGDKDNRKSITGFIIFLLGAPILWRSKAQGSVALSSTEAEFYALSEAAKEIKFIVQVLISMGIPVKLPVIVRVDNVGAIFMSENVSTSSRTKHTDTRYHFVREFVEEGFVKIVFVRSEDNISDPFTKNTPGSIYEKHTAEFVAEKESLLNGD